MEETRSPREATDAAPEETRPRCRHHAHDCFALGGAATCRLSRSPSRWPKSSGSRRPAISILLAEIERFEKAGYLDPARRGDRADEAEGDLVTPIWRHVAALGLVPASPVDGRLEAGWLGHCPQEKRDALQPRNTYGSDER
jgi:hypothetical protein